MIDKFKMYKQLLSNGVTDHGCLFCDCENSDITRGSTVRHTLSIPADTSILNNILITYKQGSIKVLEKKITDVNKNGNIIYYDLSEGETLKFREDIPVFIQARMLFKDKRIINTDKFECKVIGVLDDQAITDTSIYRYPIEAKISGQRIEINDYLNIIQNSNGLYKCKLTFDSTWDLFIKRAVFKDTNNHKVYTDILEDGHHHYECLLPDILLDRPGWINMGVSGVYTDSKVSIGMPTIWSKSIKVTESCLRSDGIDPVGFDKLYVYQGVTDDAYNFKLPQELEVTAVTKQALKDGYTWKGYWLDNQYHVLAIPSYLNIECEKVVQNGFDIKPTSHQISDSGKYTFYYFSSRATGEFTSTYYFKEVE